MLMNLPDFLAAMAGGRHTAVRDLEQKIAPSDAPPERRHQNLSALAYRYRHLLEQTVALFGGPEQVLAHYRSLRECQKAGGLPVPDLDAEEQFETGCRGAADCVRAGPIEWVLGGDYYGDCTR